MVCNRYNQKVGRWYARGLKYCGICEIAVKPTYERCPCCHQMLRVKPHRHRFKLQKELVYY